MKDKSEGEAVGDLVSLAVGEETGDCDMALELLEMDINLVGWLDAWTTAWCKANVGERVGFADEGAVTFRVGLLLRVLEGRALVILVGFAVGDEVTFRVGLLLGVLEGRVLIIRVGFAVGGEVTFRVGLLLGVLDGKALVTLVLKLPPWAWWDAARIRLLSDSAISSWRLLKKDFENVLIPLCWLNSLVVMWVNSVSPKTNLFFSSALLTAMKSRLRE